MSKIDWSNKKQVLIAVKNNGYSLLYASDNLQNDLGLLKLLKNYHMSKSIPNNPSKAKTRKF